MAVFVTRMAFPVLVCILMRGALVGGRRAVTVAVQPLILPAAGAGGGVGPEAREARRITVWKHNLKVINTPAAKSTTKED